MARQHSYAVTVTWTGNNGTGTSGYRDYQRSHNLSASGKTTIAGSSDPAFRGDPACWSPEDLLVGSLAACHQLWYLHLCAVAGISVETYSDHAEGWMEEAPDGSGQFVKVILRPQVKIAAASDQERARSLHEKAHAMCFLARSVNFPVICQPVAGY